MSLPTVNAPAQADINYIVNLIKGPGNGLANPTLGDEANEIFSRNYAQWGYRSQVSLNDGLRDHPTLVLLRVIRYLASGTLPSA